MMTSGGKPDKPPTTGDLRNQVSTHTLFCGDPLTSIDEDPGKTPTLQGPRTQACAWPWDVTPPLGVKPKEAARLIGGSRSVVYRLLREGKLRAVKRGATLIVLTESIYTHMASLPPASFGAPSPADTDLT
jgi:excisionase family DNA binding protein